MFDVKEYLDTKCTLRFREDGSFKIMLMGDPHGGVDSHPQLYPGVEALVEAGRPDLVLLMGDQCGHSIGTATKDELYDYLTKLTRPMEERGIPWAHVFGNHDFNNGVTNEMGMEVYQRFAHCLSKFGPEDVSGVGNYVLPILHAHDDEPAFNVWAMDSHGDNGDYCRDHDQPTDTKIILRDCFGMGHGYGSANPYTDQLLWYYQTSKEMERTYGRKIPGILYQHIPLPEHALIPRNPQQTFMTGSMYEHVATCELNTGLFAAMFQRGDIKGVFVGHDHLNDYCGQYCGIYLGACSGVNYDAGSRDDMRGARIIELTEDNPGVLNTYMLRLRDVMGAEVSDSKLWR